MEPTHICLTIPESVELSLLMGASDSYLRRVEEAFDAMITVRGNQIRIVGPSDEANRAMSVFSQLISLAESGDTPSSADVELCIAKAARGTKHSIEGNYANDILLTTRGRVIRPKTEGQVGYVRAIDTHTITFGLGPAGTGKTYLAMAMAVAALKRREVSKIVLTRPVVEAGESLGFLPGTLQEKLDPYIRPLYDALFEMCGMERANALIEQGVIEIAPLAFMRGRTLSEAFVILDEAQNTTPEQMKMFLTRLGYASKFVITGDVTQRDLKGASGIDVAQRVLKDIEDIAFIVLDANDVVRHSLVAKIVDAYKKAEGQRDGSV